MDRSFGRGATATMFVYVLKSLRDGRRYVGMTENLPRRLEEHNKGLERSTRGRRPFELLYYEEVADRISARGREKYFKSAAGRRYLARIITQRPRSSSGYPPDRTRATLWIGRSGGEQQPLCSYTF